jgi:hypothetical protein
MTTEQQTLKNLESKLADARGALEKAQHEADGFSYDAHCGDRAAKASLAKAQAEVAQRQGDIRSLGAALAEAHRRLTAADAAAVDEVERTKASAALERLKDFEARAAKLDAGLAAFVEEFRKLEADWRALAGLGYAAPSTFQLAQLNVALAAGTKLQEVGLSPRFLAPHERRTFAQVIGGWTNIVKTRAHARLKKDAARAA